MTAASSPPRSGRRYRAPDPKYMTLVEHLQELRSRLFRIVLAVVAGSVVGWFISGRIEKLLDAPVCNALNHQNCHLIITTIYGGFTLQLKIAVVVGFGIALPITLFQVWRFIAPAFGPGANWWAPVWITAAFSLFAGGVVTGYFVIPLAVNFFSHFQNPSTQLLIFAADYVSFVILILLVFGISFELPLVLVTLTAVGLTTSRWLSSKRVYFFFGIFAFATIITPGADWISPLILGGIMYVLYELAILVSRFILHK